MSWLENKYIGLISTRLRNFKRKSSNLYNFSCPICGDSKRVKSKARGFIYEKSGKLMFHCHNCGETKSIPGLIKLVDPGLYDEYRFEKLAETGRPREKSDVEIFAEKMKKPVFMNSGPLRGLKKVSQLSPDDPIKKFVVSRMIPNPFHAKLFACPNFMRYTNQLLPGKFSDSALRYDDTRLLIPFLTKEGSLHAYQGRSLGDSKAKYITIVLDETVPKLYGLDRVDKSKRVTVVEGPIDAMFLHNAVATAGGDLTAAMQTFSKDSMVIAYDNEPRSRDTVKKIDKAIMQGYSVVIWPENLDHKDVNDMVKAGMSSEFVEYVIQQNTYRDLSAKLALQKWSKV